MFVKKKENEIRGGVLHTLSIPFFYNLFQTSIGANAWRQREISKHLITRAASNPSIIDLGCGTGTTLTYFPHNINYLGIDRNAAYIAHAARKFRDNYKNAKFLNSEIGHNFLFNGKFFEIVLAIGLIHHLDNYECSCLIKEIKQIMQPESVFFALDPLFDEKQSAVARMIISADRGKNVRNLKEYIELYSAEFSNIEYFIDYSPLLIPYTGIVFMCRI